MRSVIHCIAEHPGGGAIVSPVNVELRWTSDIGTYKVYFGTDENNLTLISTQNERTYTLTDLEVNTKYYWRVETETQCLRCSTVTSSFTTVPDISLPYVLTAPVCIHSSAPPRVGGNIIYEGLSSISDRGIYYSLSPAPEISGSKFQINSGKGLFSDLIPGLATNSKYYAKAYATNSSGTSFGPEVSFVTGQVSVYNTISDRDGNFYYVITIGNQTWMAENLRTTKFNDGTPIPNFPDNSWGHLTTPAYCWYDNNQGIKTTYGALYNGYTIDTVTNGYRNVCPVGWHVPDDMEWSELIGFLGGESVAGSQLKEAGDYYWLKANGSNSSGFSALAGGERIDFDAGNGAVFYNIGYLATFWSKSFNSGSHWLELRSDVPTTENNIYKKNEGHSVRCIKNTK